MKKVLYVRLPAELHAAVTAAARSEGFSLVADWARKKLAEGSAAFAGVAAPVRDERQTVLPDLRDPTTHSVDDFPGATDPSPTAKGSETAKASKAKASKSKPHASASKARKASKRTSARKSTTTKPPRKGRAK